MCVRVCAHESFPHTLSACHCDSLLIEGASAASGRAVFTESLRELLVQIVRHGTWNALPGQNQNDHHGVLTAVTGTLPHETQQLLLLASPPNDLKNTTHTCVNRFPDTSLQTMMRVKWVTDPLGDWATLGAPPLFASVDHDLHADCFAFLAVPVMRTLSTL